MTINRRKDWLQWLPIAGTWIWWSIWFRNGNEWGFIPLENLILGGPGRIYWMILCRLNQSERGNQINWYPSRRPQREIASASTRLLSAAVDCLFTPFNSFFTNCIPFEWLSTTFESISVHLTLIFFTHWMEFTWLSSRFNCIGYQLIYSMIINDIIVNESI